MDGTNGRNPVAEFIHGRDGNLYAFMADVTKTPAASGSRGSLIRLVEPPKPTEITFTNGTAVLTWSSFSNGIYRVEQRASLSETNWTPLAPNVTARGSTASFTNSSAGASEGYYRVMLLP